MSIIRSLIIIMALGAAAGAQQTNNAPAAQARQAEAVSPDKLQGNKPLVAREEKKQAPPAKKYIEANQDEEEGNVMVDTKAGEDVRDLSSDSEREYEEKNAAGGVPSSYGQLKGALTEGGRGVLVFENEDGVISLVQVTMGRGPVSWKLISKIPRSAD